MDCLVGGTDFRIRQRKTLLWRDFTSFEHGIPPTSTDEELDRHAHGAALLAHGHTHVQSLRRTPKTTAFNPGRIGGDLDRVLRGMKHDLDGCAEYAVASLRRVDLRRVRYDLDAYRRSIVESGMPHAEEAARRLA